MFELPDTGGFLANGVAIQADSLEVFVRGVFQRRAEASRAVFVRPAPSDRCSDLALLSTAAEAAGGHAFDARASGWPDPAIVVDSLPTDTVP